jgi:hypothetical protein
MLGLCENTIVPLLISTSCLMGPADLIARPNTGQLQRTQLLCNSDVIDILTTRQDGRPTTAVHAFH